MPANRSRKTDPLKKTGYQIRLSVVKAVRDAVDQGAAESQNAFVERALVRELKELRRRRVYEAYADAASDPDFMKDMEATTAAYEEGTGDGLQS